MTAFAHQALPWNIIFGLGSIDRLPAAMDARGMDRALVLTTPGREESGQAVARLLADRSVGLLANARMHVPRGTVEEAAKVARDLGAKCTVSIGGGSTTGLGKALAAREGLSNSAVPTTYAGSEMTDIWSVTESGRKVTRRDACVVPAITVYDPGLTVTLPPRVSAASGLNALAQAVVNVATSVPNPFASSLGVEAIRKLGKWLPVVVAEPGDLKARSEALCGACLAAGALGVGSTGLHHRLCHAFGGTFDTPHAETHAILLPHTVAFNAPSATEGTQRVARALGVDDAALGLHHLAWRIGAPTALRRIGVKAGDLEVVAAVASRGSFSNREQVAAVRVRAMLQDAFEGRAPGSVRAARGPESKRTEASK